MGEKVNAAQYNGDLKTFNSQQSCIDIFSKIESLFLQKFFRYNLIDYFSQDFSSVQDELVLKPSKNHKINQLSAHSFLAKAPIKTEDFEFKMNEFYSGRSKCAENKEIPYSFKHIFSNVKHPQDTLIEDKQLIIMQVKIKAQIQKIQSLPTLFYKELQHCRLDSLNQQKDSIVSKMKFYNKKVIHLFFVYYGDINFDNFRKQNYQPTKINFFNHQVLVKIHVFYISRIAMLETFKKMSKIQHMDYINDLLIQLYEYKREVIKKKKKKALSKKQKEIDQSTMKIQNQKDKYTNLKWIAAASLSGIAIGTLIFKLVS